MRLACASYAGPMLSCSRTSRIPMPSGYLLGRGEKPCSTSPCSWDLRCSARTSRTSASAIVGETARAPRRGPPMPFLCSARRSAVDFLCGSGPFSPRHEIANSYSVAPGRHRPSSAFRCWRLSDARRDAVRDRRAAGGSPRGCHRHHLDLATAGDRVNDPAPQFSEGKQSCSMSS